MSIEEKYPDEYFSHWLAMFEMNQNNWSEQSVLDQIDMYIQLEGEEEFDLLKSEVRSIVADNDLNAFLNDLNRNNEDQCTMEEMVSMVHLISNYSLKR